MATKKKLDLTDVDARTTPVGLFNFAETYWLSAKAGDVPASVEIVK